MSDEEAEESGCEEDAVEETDEVAEVVQEVAQEVAEAEVAEAEVAEEKTNDAMRPQHQVLDDFQELLDKSRQSLGQDASAPLSKCLNAIQLNISAGRRKLREAAALDPAVMTELRKLTISR